MVFHIRYEDQIKINKTNYLRLCLSDEIGSEYALGMYECELERVILTLKDDEEYFVTMLQTDETDIQTL